MSTKKLQIIGSFGSEVEVDYTLSKTGMAADAKTTGDAITNLNTLVGDTPVSEQIDAALADIEEQLATLLYNPITISSFTIGDVVAVSAGETITTKSPIEIGSTVTSVTLNWKTSRTPKTVTLDGASIDVNTTSHTYDNLSLIKTKKYNLKITGEKDEVATDSETLTICNHVCYGVAENPEVINSDFVMSLTNRPLTTSKAHSGVKYNAGEGQYLWYCVPTSLGVCTFTDIETNLSAGMSLVDTIKVKNSSEYEENYYIYRSDYAGLGSLTVKVY